MYQLISGVAGFALAAGAWSCARADDIHLACDGIARHHVAELFIDITGDGGRIKMPAVLIPTIRTTSDEGWRPMKDVKLGDIEINAKLTMNALDNPSITINRVTGHIELVGLGGGFDGQCHPYDATAAARKF